MSALRIPARRVAQLDGLDQDEIAEGYRDGYAGEPEPGDNRSFAHWHGWRNGAVDGGHKEPDAAQREFAADYVRRQRSVG